MKRFSQTLKVMLALFVAIFSNGLLPSVAAFATPGQGNSDGKVFVCKYVGTPGVDERLQTGDNPISVSVNAIPNYNGVGSYFADAHGRSYVLEVDNGQAEPDVSECPAPVSPIKVTPVAPSVNDVCGTANDTVTLPTTTGITYSKSQVGLVVTVTATPQAGYAIKAGNGYTVGANGIATYVVTLTNVSCPPGPTQVTPVAPSVNDVCGTANDTVTLPTTTGITYSKSQVGLVVTVTATAQQGYVLLAGNGYTLNYDGTATYKVNLTDKDCPKVTICHRTASATNPYVSITVDESSVDGDTGNDNGKGDHYAEHTGPIFPATGEDGKWGDIIPPVAGHNGLNWSEAGQEILRNDCNVPVKISVTPGPCAYYDTTSTLSINVTGTAKDSELVVYDSSDQVVYSVDIEVDKDGEVTSPTFPVSVDLPAGTYTIEVIKGEKVLASTSATIELCYYPVTPKQPKKVDFCYDDKDMIFIKSTEGVIYKVNGVETSGWVHYSGETLVVTAEAAPGYVLSEEATTTWTYDAEDFSNEQCITITKTGKVANDTNHDGFIGVGDTVTWEITVTNISDSKYEKFYVTLEDTDVTLENDGYIGYLGAGESVTLTATSTLTADDLRACKATNTATFFGWRAHKSRDIESDSLRLFNDESEPLATGSASAEFTITCPTPGSGSGETPTPETPATLPATGPADNSSPLLVLAAAAIAYGATYFVQRRRELATN